MTAYQILKEAGLPAGRNSILNLADRKRVARYYGNGVHRHGSGNYRSHQGNL